MFFRRILVFPIVAVLGLFAWTPAQTDETSSSTDISSTMQAHVKSGELSGAVTVVGNKHGIVSLDVVGLQNLEQKIPMAKDSLFRIASMTKPITALGIMMLAEEGKLSIDDPVEKHLPEFRGQMLVAEKGKDTVTLKKPARPITIKDLLTHTSGQPGFAPGLGDLYSKRSYSLAEAVMAFSQRPLDFEPGSKWNYSNTGYDILGRIIEVVFGQAYEKFLKERIFDPLGMIDTVFYPTETQLKRLALTYDRKDGQLVLPTKPFLALPKGARYPIPAGGLYSTGPDLAKLYRALLNGGSFADRKIVTPATLKLMTSVQTGDLDAGFSPGSGWGLGWHIVVTPTGVTEKLSRGAYGHGGAFGTQSFIDPEKGAFYIELIQRENLPGPDGAKIWQEFQAAAMRALKK